MIDELVGELEELGLKIEDVVSVQGDTLIKTSDGVDIWFFADDDLEPRLEFNDLVYFTDGGPDLAVSIVNAHEAIRVARVTI